MWKFAQFMAHSLDKCWLRCSDNGFVYTEDICFSSLLKEGPLKENGAREEVASVLTFWSLAGALQGDGGRGGHAFVCLEAGDARLARP